MRIFCIIFKILTYQNNHCFSLETSFTIEFDTWVEGFLDQILRKKLTKKYGLMSFSIFKGLVFLSGYQCQGKIFTKTSFPTLKKIKIKLLCVWLVKKSFLKSFKLNLQNGRFSSISLELATLDRPSLAI